LAQIFEIKLSKNTREVVLIDTSPALHKIETRFIYLFAAKLVIKTAIW